MNGKSKVPTIGNSFQKSIRARALISKKQEIPRSRAKHEIPTERAKHEIPTERAKHEIPTERAKHDRAMCTFPDL
jgi:hypothetical protein